MTVLGMWLVARITSARASLQAIKRLARSVEKLWTACGERAYEIGDGAGYCSSVGNRVGFVDSSESVKNLSLLFRIEGDRAIRSPDLFP